MNGYVVQGKPGRWTIRPLTPNGRPLCDEAGNVRTWSTKKEAELERRVLESELENVSESRQDSFRKRVDRSRRR